jgi:hypothetical protein
VTLDIFLTPSTASALPVFAHRYGFSCQQCHTTVPQLNTFGQKFLRNGFRLDGARTVEPVAVKVQTAYSSGGQGGGLPKAIVDEVEILSAGSIGRNTSYFFEQYAVDGGEPGRPRDMWVELHRPLGNATGTELRARVGQFTLPLPVDPETQRPTLQHYAVFDQTVGANAFTLFDPRTGADFSVTNDNAGLTVHAVVVQAVDRGSGLASAGVDLMGSVSKSIGSNWTAYAYRYQGARPLGPVRDRFYREGWALDFSRGKLGTTAVLQNGSDTSADGFGLGARSSGGFVQTGWAFNAGLALYARYDEAYDPLGLRTTTGTLSLVTRPRRNMRFTLEGTRGTDHTYQLGAGLLFAY